MKHDQQLPIVVNSSYYNKQYQRMYSLLLERYITTRTTITITTTIRIAPIMAPITIPPIAPLDKAVERERSVDGRKEYIHEIHSMLTIPTHIHTGNITFCNSKKQYNCHDSVIDKLRTCGFTIPSGLESTVIIGLMEDDEMLPVEVTDTVAVDAAAMMGIIHYYYY